MAAAKYVPTEVERKWQEYWEREKTFRTPNPGEPGFDAAKRKYYILDMFPYPSGEGLHVGHPYGYTATDVLARYKRMRGFNVLHPTGWDAFGLPAEQYAVTKGMHPVETTKKNTDAFRETLKKLGFTYDWDREINTSTPKYYHWTQWIFLQLFNSIFDTRVNKARDVQEIAGELNAGKIAVKNGSTLVFDKTAAQATAAGFGKQWSELNADEQWRVLAAHRLAYVSEAPVWWCEELGTVLANEEVIDGRSERGDFPCVKKPLRQWVLRITVYAERLLDDLEGIEWPEPIKLMQRNWIGRSEGAEVDFTIADCGGDSVSPNPGGLGIADLKIRVFTTRPDTLYGATYMVLAPEHPLVKQITIPEQKAAVEQYVLEASRKSDLARTDLAKDKSGVFTGAYAYNPVFEKSDPRAKIPIWTADYVLMGYGTGAIMAVPAHDERDFEFATKFKLPKKVVVRPDDNWIAANMPSVDEIVKLDTSKKLSIPSSEVTKHLLVLSKPATASENEALFEFLVHLYSQFPEKFATVFTEDGTAMNSTAEMNGKPTPEAKKKITQWLNEKKLGETKITYRLRDWLFSRQRYWGEPFPIVWDDRGHARALAVDQLPLILPEMSDFKPTGSTEPPLSKAKEWVNVCIAVQSDGTAKVATGGTAGTRETNTMPGWAGSSWYFLRFADPNNDAEPFSKTAENYWMNVDLYVGGAEHAVLHLLYSRFWHKVLFDRGHVHTTEPFQRLFNQGKIQAFVFEDAAGRKYPNDEVEQKPDGTYVHKTTGALMNQRIGKMSKTLKNVIPADDVIAEYGADTLRLYEMFMGPLESSKPWNPQDVPGMFRFLRDCWRMLIEDDESKSNAGAVRTNLLPSASELIGDRSEEVERDLHKTIKGVTNDFERMAFNTAISKLMVFKNKVMEDPTALTRSQAKRFVLLLSPLAPHIAEEFWSLLRHNHTLAYEAWPTFDEALTQDATKELPVQVNGKVKARITVAANASDDDVKKLALEAVKNDLAGKTVVKVIVVPGRLVNIVVK